MYRLLTIKGAPDILIERCAYYITDMGDIASLDREMKAMLEHFKNKYSSQGKRCLLLARKVVSHQDLDDAPGTTQFENSILEQSKSGLILVGMVAIVDPLRPEIRNVVSTLRGAGVRIAMVGITRFPPSDKTPLTSLWPGYGRFRPDSPCHRP